MKTSSSGAEREWGNRSNVPGARPLGGPGILRKQIPRDKLLSAWPPKVPGMGSGREKIQEHVSNARRKNIVIEEKNKLFKIHMPFETYLSRINAKMDFLTFV